MAEASVSGAAEGARRTRARPSPAILVGAVACEPSAVSFWEGVRAHFLAQEVPLEFALFSTYECLGDSLVAGHVDAAWNSPLGHVRVRRRTEGRSISLAMRDSDRDARSKLIVRRGAGVRSLLDIAGRTLAVGSRDSARARILPLQFLGEAGVDLSRVRLLALDADLGRHGDTGASELEVLAAVGDGRAQAGVVGERVWTTESSAGRVDPAAVEVLWTSPPYDERMFDGHPALPPLRAEAFRRALFSMRWDDPGHRRLLELEGMRQWVPPREKGYASLVRALDAQGAW